jgi:hypothetical protein
MAVTHGVAFLARPTPLDLQRLAAPPFPHTLSEPTRPDQKRRRYAREEVAAVVASG